MVGRAVAAAACVVALGTAMAQSWDFRTTGTWPKPISDDLKRPTQVTHFRPPRFERETGDSPIELVGISPAEVPIEKKPRIEAGRGGDDVWCWHFSEGKRVHFRLYWRRRGAIKEPWEAEVRIAGSGPPRKQRHSIPLEEWGLGAVNATELTLPVYRLRYSGHATLEVWSGPGGEDNKRHRLYTQPAFVTPALVESRIQHERLVKHFGANMTPIGKSVRLGPGAQVEMVVPGAAMPATAIGLVSRLAFATDYCQGSPVLEIEVLDAEGNIIDKGSAKVGVHTSLDDLGRFGPNELDFRAAPVFRTIGEVTSPESGQTYERHLYGARIEMRLPAETARVNLVYLHDSGLIEIMDVALLGTNEAK